jgi:hypothetical protein
LNRFSCAGQEHAPVLAQIYNEIRRKSETDKDKKRFKFASKEKPNTPFQAAERLDAVFFNTPFRKKERGFAAGIHIMVWGILI